MGVHDTMTTEAKQYYTPKELSALLRCITVKTLANWRLSSNNSDGPPFIRAGGRVLYPARGLQSWETRRAGGRRAPL
jgi:hypothetical protein